MERILYFDCFAGISGAMSIGALVDLGLDPSAVIAEIRKLGVRGYDIEIKKISRFSIGGTDVKVTLTGETDCVHDHGHVGDGCDHKHDHDHKHDRELDCDGHERTHGGHGHHHNDRERSLADITHIIRSGGISEKAKELSIAIFTEIAKAEAAVHAKRIEEVHFHEVGAIDSIVDIVGAHWALHCLKVERIMASALNLGSGTIKVAHGVMPVPEIGRASRRERV